jgi:Lipase maturation factor
MNAAAVVRWLFDSDPGASNRLIPRWLFLRALGLIYCSAFYSLLFQIRGLIGPDGLLPARTYLPAVARAFGPARFWFAPTLLWLSTTGGALTALCWIGFAASLLLVLNLWPRGTLAICFVCFLSFIAAAQDFSSYQSDGMLLAAGFVAFFFAPPGWRPGWGDTHPPSRAALWLLLWEWFRIYFESGLAKMAGDVEWRNLTAMDQYYQNGPLPTWIGWYVQHLPHGFHVATALATLVLELGIVWLLFAPRRLRLACCAIVTGWQIGVILTANYAFLNYLVLVLGVLLLDDGVLRPLMPARWRPAAVEPEPAARADPAAAAEVDTGAGEPQWPSRSGLLRTFRLSLTGALFLWIFYATCAPLLWMIEPDLPLPTTPLRVLEPFRIANQYGLFGRMTRGRYEIEFQGSTDGHTWVAYPFRYKPQALDAAPGIYAPYQPRFDWNLWFASLGSWRDYPFVAQTEERLLANDADVLALFAANPFPGTPPHEVRAVLWQYWFTTSAEKRQDGDWWRRQLLGLYAPVLVRGTDGRITVAEWPDLPPRE